MKTAAERERQRRSRQKSVARRRAAGLCVDCNQPARSGRTQCEKCASSLYTRRRARASAHPEATREKQRWARRKTLYGISRREWESLFLAQGRRCGICGRGDPGAGQPDWSTDHDHETGRVRGILCAPCNAGLGNFGDSPDTLRAARGYLRRFKVRAAPPKRTGAAQLTLVRGGESERGLA